MTLYWVYNLPNWLFAMLVTATFVVVATVGLLLSRGIVLRVFGRHACNDVISYYLATVVVFYGITLGLISVATYQTYSDLNESVSLEAATVASIYRDVSDYPEPARTRLRAAVAEYTRVTIEDAWPKQKQGIVPGAGATNDLQRALDAFEPSSARETIVHAEALRQFNHLVELEWHRLQNVSGGLPAMMWGVIILGAVATVAMSWALVLDNFRLHLFLNAALAALLGLLVFLIGAVDNPFRGQFSVGPDAFIAVRDQLMKSGR